MRAMSFRSSGYLLPVDLPRLPSGDKEVAAGVARREFCRRSMSIAAPSFDTPLAGPCLQTRSGATGSYARTIDARALSSFRSGSDHTAQLRTNESESRHHFA